FLQATPLGVPSPRRPGEGMNEFLGALLQGVDIDPAKFTDGPAGVRVALQKARRKKSPDVYARLTDEQLSDVYSYHIFPNMCLVMFSDYAVAYRYMPHPDDPGRGYIDFMNLTRDKGSPKGQH